MKAAPLTPADDGRGLDPDTVSPSVTPQDVADLELGRLVRKMPEEADLYRNGAIWVCAAGVAILGTGDTPEQAIRAALEEST